MGLKWLILKAIKELKLMLNIGLGHYLTLAAIIFTIGVVGIFLNRKNIIKLSNMVKERYLMEVLKKRNMCQI